MIYALIRWLFWRRGVLLIGGLFLLVASIMAALLIGGGLSFLFGTGVTTIMEIEASRVETLGVGILVTAALWVITTLAR